MPECAMSHGRAIGMALAMPSDRILLVQSLAAVLWVQ